MDTTEEECLHADGLWLDDESCDNAITSTGGTLVSTGWDNFALGNFDLGASTPAFAPFGAAPTSTQGYLQWLSINEPTHPLGRIITNLSPQRIKQRPPIAMCR